LRIAYFTAGSVGAGHVVRALAVRAALVRAGAIFTLRVFSPARPHPALAGAGLDLCEVRIDPAVAADPRRASDSEWARAIAAFAPDLILADLFWLPLHHALASIGAEAWLLLRACPPHWLEGPDGVAFDRRRFARILELEPMPFDTGGEPLGPLVVAHPDEVAPPETLRNRLDVPAGVPLTLVVHAGEPGEIAALEAHARNAAPAGARVARADLHADGALFPLAPHLPHADALVGASGYNFAWECQVLDLLGRTTFHPRRRAIDDQVARAALVRRSPRVPHGGDRLATMLVRG
jgi:hypothetical protein